MGGKWKQWQTIFLGSKITVNSDCNHEIQRHLVLGRKAMTNLDSKLKSRDITLLTKVHLVKAMCFSRSHIWMWELDHKEGWVPKNWCFWIKSRLIGKVPDAGEDWEQEEKRATEGEMVEWWLWLPGHEFEQTRRWWRTGKSGVLQAMRWESNTT